MVTLTPTHRQIRTAKKCLAAAEQIAHDCSVEPRMGDGVLEVRLPGAENPRLVITVNVRSTGRASMEVMRIDDASSETLTVLTIFRADGTSNDYWTTGLRQIIINHGGELR